MHGNIDAESTTGGRRKDEGAGAKEEKDLGKARVCLCLSKWHLAANFSCFCLELSSFVFLDQNGSMWMIFLCVDHN